MRSDPRSQTCGHGPGANGRHSFLHFQYQLTLLQWKSALEDAFEQGEVEGLPVVFGRRARPRAAGAADVVGFLEAVDFLGCDHDVRRSQPHAARRVGDPIRTWAYFTKAVAKRHTQRVALAARAKSAGETKTAPTLTAYEILLRTAEWINSGRFVPPSAVNNTTRDALLRAGLVTEATLRAHQIY